MSQGLNRALLIGRLGKDPELTYTQGGTARCRFSLATSESYKDQAGEWQERTEWHNVVAWGKQAESAGKYLTKGSQACIDGKIQTRSWEDQKTGEKKYMTEINAQRVIFLGGGEAGQGERQYERQYKERDKDPGDSAQHDGPDDSDIPF